MSFGLGTLHARSTKQKLNTKSSTEAEIVGMSDYLPFNIWLRMFLEEQGFYLTNNIVHQDNQSVKIIKVRLGWKETDATLALEILGMLTSGISS